MSIPSITSAPLSDSFEWRRLSKVENPRARVQDSRWLGRQKSVERVCGSLPRKGLRSSPKRIVERGRANGLSPWTRAAKRIGRIDAIVLHSAFFSRRRLGKVSLTCKGTRIRHDRRRSGSCNCIALTGDAEAGLRHEGRDKASFLP